LDNMRPNTLREALTINAHQFPTEASGNITEDNIVAIAETGVDFISMGALTHSARNIDLSLKATH
ncbi:MAG: nicotinate-nucleotide diphosphorylase (carboxylating), partial [Flavobacteriaceae bacterium]